MSKCLLKWKNSALLAKTSKIGQQKYNFLKLQIHTVNMSTKMLSSKSQEKIVNGLCSVLVCHKDCRLQTIKMAENVGIMTLFYFGSKNYYIVFSLENLMLTLSMLCNAANFMNFPFPFSKVNSSILALLLSKY